MRYGIGLNLFEHVNNLSEAMEQAVNWANELILSSMLLEGDVKGDVKIHDIVRSFAISYAAKEEEHSFMVDGIPRWLDDETFRKYAAISLTSKNDYSRLNGVAACKLQILVLNGDLSRNIDDFFFKGMVNLEVLALSNMNFQPNLPESMRKLKKLRTLCLEGCKLGNIEEVGELVDLLVLSLRESFVDNIPNEVGNLCKLRLLDLSDCTSSKLPLIPIGVLGRLSKLEGLYMFNKRQSVFETKSDYGEVENNKLPFLNALEIRVTETEELPIDGQFMANVDKFRICVGDADLTDAVLQKFSCILYLKLKRIDDVSRFLKKSCVKVMLNRADYLEMSLEMSYNNKLEHLVPQFDQEGFRSLRSLSLSSCSGIKCIVDGCTMKNSIVFPCLQSLELMGLGDLEMVCNGDVPPGIFPNLQTIKLHMLYSLLYGLPLVPRNVYEIDVYCCNKLKFMFIEDEEELPIEMPFLKRLKFTGVPCLLSLVGPNEFFNTSDALQGTQILFDGRIVLPSLESFVLNGCNDIVKLWSKEIHKHGFQNLKDIEITKCEKLMSVGSPSVFSILEQLESLSIKECKEMCEVICVEETEESEIGEPIIRFPKLVYLELRDLTNLESFYAGGSKLEFPKLKKLILEELGNMKVFAKFENSSIFFHEKIVFPCLEDLRVISVNDEVMGLWDKQSSSVTSNPSSMLRQLALDSSARLRHIPTVVLENLSSLTLSNIQGEEAVFSSLDLVEKEGSVSIYSKLPNLEELKVGGSLSLKELFEEAGCSADYDALKLFCRQVKTLEMYNLASVNPIPLHLFKSIASLTLFDLNWDYLISAHVLEDSLHQLQFLSIGYCRYIEALVTDVGSHIKLPRLKRLCLMNLMSFRGISSTPRKEATLHLPLLESLVIDYCDILEYFWSGSLVAPRLQVVSVERCDNLHQFLAGDQEATIELPSLKKVSFELCDKFQSIASGSLTTPKLREVHLHGCAIMQCFLPGNPNHNGDLQLPSLEIVKINYCPKLHEFSHRRVQAPKLTEITYEGKEYSMLPYDDLKHFLQKINPISDS